MVGRPKQFLEEEALEKAMEVFWAQGYEAASVQDLLEAMGINRGSMYDTFGDKHSLFLQVVEHYRAQVRQRMARILDAPGSPVGNIKKLLNGAVEMGCVPRCRGCLLTNSTVELAPHDDEVAAAVRASLGETERAFHRTLRKAVEAGEINAGADTRALARFLNGTLQGLVVMGKASLGRPVMEDAVRVALSALDG